MLKIRWKNGFRCEWGLCADLVVEVAVYRDEEFGTWEQEAR